MYSGSLYHGDIIGAFERHVPGVYVRDYRANGGYITLCRFYRDIPWRDQTTTRLVERQIPAVTLVNLPRGQVTAPSRFHGLRLDRPGWRREFRRAMPNLTKNQMLAITRELGEEELFPGVCNDRRVELDDED